ncbi:MAG TPA: sigma-70 family RNA polymerase sigma factor, partial [Patescibacteria group bacterium]|nr:sigma-70 family RNA polymerase sigma factor [Patescibacteria group bacterium]
MEPSDEELRRRIAARDADAFELMVERHQARAYRLAASILGNQADARDVSQDAFIRLYEAAGRFDGRSRFSTWFYRILV